MGETVTGDRGPELRAAIGRRGFLRRAGALAVGSLTTATLPQADVAAASSGAVSIPPAESACDASFVPVKTRAQRPAIGVMRGE